MPVFDPSTHDDRIDIDITLGSPATGLASFSTLAVIVDTATPGGGRFAEYFSPEEVAADVLLGNLNAIAQAIADVAFGQINRPEKIVFIGVNTGSAETYVQALDAAIAGGADFYGVAIDSRTDAVIVAVGTDIEGKAASGTYLLFLTMNDDADWLTSGIATAYADLKGFERVAMYWHDDNANDATSARLEVASGADRLAIDVDEKSASWNATVREVDALATPLTQAQKAFARANYANTALPMGTRTDTYVDPGKTLAGRPIDHVVTSDWIRARTSEGVADLITSVSERGVKLTVSLDGQNRIGAVIESVLQNGITAGHILDYELTPLPITDADIAAQRVRYSGTAQLASGILQVGISLYFDTVAL